MEEEKREQIISRVTDAIVEVDSNWRFTLVNEQAEDLYGMDAESLLGRDFWDVFEAARGTTFEEEYLEVMETREPTSFVEYHSQLDGWFDIKAYPMDDGGIAFYFIEVTEQYERQRSLQERVKELSAIHDTTNLFQTVDAPMEELFSVFIERLPKSFQYPDITEARLRYDGIDVSTTEFESRDHVLTAHADLDHGSTLELDVGVASDSRIDDDNPFLAEEEELLETLVTVVKNNVQRRTHLRDLERANKFLSTLFDTIPAGVVVLDRNGTITQVNSYAEEELGVEKSEITDRTYQDPRWEIFGENGEPVPPEELPFSQVMQTGEMVVGYEHGIVLPDGSKRWLSINASPITTETGEVEKIIAVIRDDTNLRAYRQRLDTKNERLEQFSSTVSHDLRNPLSVAQGRLGLAQEECDSEHLEYVDRAHRRMETLIEDMLTLAREGKAVTDPESVDLSALVKDCWTNVETEDATVVVDIDRTVQGDESRLQQMFENLFRNAVLHGGEEITVRIGDLEGGFYLEDDGQGIPEGARENIFDAGYSTSEEGTGFGLNIVKEIVEAHGWEIRVTEGVDGGARFEITGVEFVTD